MKTIGFFEVHGRFIKPTTESGSSLICPYGESSYDDFGNRTYPSCDSMCPHFGDIKRNKGKYEVCLTCGSGKTTLQTEKVKVYK